ncbi:branched-chain amino acid ABC transporter permease [Agrobacterium vitis]|uniref:Branched-chain amino acid ABC transporter permease n=1 Tax=Agrobacterium vitis TaxID=373 RepID=A0A120D988_AGRVI|nr:branched-chain amino acid ABC transporter permease [Agrobacterium vitis]KAA3509813.1 branched-chain amino acid ABC transporter permease [Agrobacterium vitis]KAA3523435.1 branched-chain amino acid ABC transporter permease [Agrobacterium vitis]MCF1479035.1 branched-chain amino acid ABC transporter permease [Agrobacterium vitis]MUO80304.1 branched-chain amino acid ABC transporter permease [Agrobacterium vitis]MUO94896.1 branched-chain amino acid ABC transporter permease [Agrobacterium vitis]
MGAYGMFLVSGLAVGALYALGGVGLVILNRATGVLNFAYGAIGAVGAMSAWQLLAWKLPEPLAWGGCLAVSLLLSLGFGLLVAPGLSKREPVVKAVATLGFALCLLGVMNLLWVVTPRKLSLFSDMLSVDLLGMRVNGTRLIALVTGLVVTLGMGIYLARTRMGLLMRSLADNREVASVLGIPIQRVEAVAWGLSGLLAGFTGLMFGDLVRLDPAVLTFLVIPMIATTVVGRLQSIPVTFCAGLIIGVIESMLTLVKPLAPLRVAAPFVIAILALMWLQRGRQLTFSGED